MVCLLRKEWAEKSPGIVCQREWVKENSALASFIVSGVIAATLFITAKQNTIFTSEQLSIWEFSI